MTAIACGWFVLILAAALAGCGQPSDPVAEPAADDWRMAGGDVTRTFGVGPEFQFGGLTKQWTANVSGTAVGTAWAHNRLIVTTWEGPIHIVDPSTQTVERSLPGLPEPPGPVIISDDIVVSVGVDKGQNGHAYRLLSFSAGATTGELSSSQPQRSLSRHPVIEDGRLFYEDEVGFIVAWDLQEQRIAWQYAIDDPNGWSQFNMQGLLVHDGMVYAAMDEAELYALDAKTGAFVWMYDHFGSTLQGPSTDGRTLFFTGNDDPRELVALSYEGKFLWSFFAGATVPHPPIIADGKAFLYSWDGSVYAIDTDTGKVAWRRILDESSCYGVSLCGKQSRGMAYSSGVLAIAAQDGNLYIADADDGTIIGSSLGDSPKGTITPIIAGDQLYVATGSTIAAYSMS